MWRTLLRLGAVGPLVAALSGCGLVGVPQAAGPVPPFPECAQATEFAFIGESSLSALGLGQGSPDDQRIGQIWVTADPVPMGGPAPIGVPADVAASRMVCVQWPDGSGMGMSIDDAWQPPSAAASGADEAEGPPIGLIGLLVAAGVLVGASALAFRERPAG